MARYAMVRLTHALRSLVLLVSFTGVLPAFLTTSLTASVAASMAVVLSGCLADAPGGDGDDGDPPLPGGPGPSEDEAKPDAKMCVGTGATGQPCEVSGDCTAPLACINKVCVGPNDPSHTCDEVDGAACKDSRETCAPTGVCVIVPGECKTTDQCPTGFLCHEQRCVPERDGQACLDPGPGPTLTGTWTFQSTLHMRDGLPGVLSGLLTATEIIRDLVKGTIDWGLPPLLESILNGIIPLVIDRYIPEWAQQIPVTLAAVSDVIDDLGVESTVYLAGGTCEASYRGYSTWDKITLKYAGQVVTRAPKDIPEIGAITPEEFVATYSCGHLYIDRHRVKNKWSGLFRYVVNTIIEISTGKPTLEKALNDAIDCNGLATTINEGLRKALNDPKLDKTAQIRGACTNAVGGLVTQINAILDAAKVPLSVVSLQGSARVDTARKLSPGKWTGSVVGFDFPGTFSAEKR